VAGDDPDMVRKMRIGQLHAAVLSGTGLYDIAPETQALMMPMMFASYEEFDYVMTGIGPKLEAILESKGFKVLNWGDAGWVHFFTQRPVVRPDDLRALRLFAWTGYTAYVEAWKDAGYQPVPLASTEIHTGLQSNAHRGTLIPVVRLGQAYDRHQLGSADRRNGDFHEEVAKNPRRCEAPTSIGLR
jgi:TRAP-type C4-dicarboxylate transport system substrate-binding protein